MWVGLGGYYEGLIFRAGNIKGLHTIYASLFIFKKIKEILYIIKNTIMADDVKNPADDKGSGFDFSTFINADVLKWIAGGVSEKPSDMNKLGDDFATKLNWFIACGILAQYSRIPRLFTAMKKVEDELYKDESIDKLILDSVDDPSKLTETYKNLTGKINDVMEFARKFVVQNKDLLIDNSDFFDRQLFEKIKSLPLGIVKNVLTLLNILDVKGFDLLDEIIENYK